MTCSECKHASTDHRTPKEAVCNGICVMDYELIQFGSGQVAYPHPECELHSLYSCRSCVAEGTECPALVRPE